MTDSRWREARETVGRVMVVVGIGFYLIGAFAMVADAGPAVYGPPFALTSALWLLQWVVRP